MKPPAPRITTRAGWWGWPFSSMARLSNRGDAHAERPGAGDHRLIETEDRLRVHAGGDGKVQRVAGTQLQGAVSRNPGRAAEFVPPRNGDRAVPLRKFMHSGNRLLAEARSR